MCILHMEIKYSNKLKKKREKKLLIWLEPSSSSSCLKVWVFIKYMKLIFLQKKKKIVRTFFHFFSKKKNKSLPFSFIFRFQMNKKERKMNSVSWINIFFQMKTQKMKGSHLYFCYMMFLLLFRFFFYSSHWFDLFSF